MTDAVTQTMDENQNMSTGADVAADGLGDDGGDVGDVVVAATWFDRDKNKKRCEVATQAGTSLTVISSHLFHSVQPKLTHYIRQIECQLDAEADVISA